MTEEEFWGFIERAHGTGGDDEHAHRLADLLHQADASRIVAFALAYESKLRLADRGAIWAAGVLLNGGHGSDDGFLYFRHWLIGQGGPVYSAALAEPDCLADLDVPLVEGQPSAEWERFGAAANGVYRSKTQGDLRARLSRRAVHLTSGQPDGWEWSQYDEAYMRVHLPKLWSRYGSYKVKFDGGVESLVQERSERAGRAEAEIAGLGTVAAGVMLVHRAFGTGTVLGVEPNLAGVLLSIDFDGTKRHLHVDSSTRDPFSRPVDR